jgi:hypothetical protein
MAHKIHNTPKNYIMKTIITVAFSVLVFVTAGSAQKPTFGLNFGPTVSSFREKGEGETYTSGSQVGFTAGVVADVPLSKSVSFQPALQFTQKGGADKDNIAGYDWKYAMTLNYIELPLNFLYKTNSPKTRFFAGGGPSLAFGIGGKEKIDVAGEHAEGDITFGSGDEDILKTLDLGANIVAGLEFKRGFTMALNYNLGLNNLENDEGYNFTNRYIGIRLGYLFNANKK